MSSGGEEFIVHTHSTRVVLKEMIIRVCESRLLWPMKIYSRGKRRTPSRFPPGRRGRNKKGGWTPPEGLRSIAATKLFDAAERHRLHNPSRQATRG